MEGVVSGPRLRVFLFPLLGGGVMVNILFYVSFSLCVGIFMCPFYIWIVRD